MNALYRYHVWFAKTGSLIYISHLDFQRLIHRVLRRSRLPVCFTGGFNPRIKLSFPYALPLFLTARREFFTLFMDEARNPEVILQELRRQTLEGLDFLSVSPGLQKFPPQPQHQYILTVSAEGIEGWK
ncbi:MAG: TIGR03936 family radical SAM-associated protein, partial [Candidatus Wallbacteria bacterium]|nr:TIGR03936 family radical SAM-associated protein [Candidatus Wallbacteria bacterium]